MYFCYILKSRKTLSRGSDPSALLYTALVILFKLVNFTLTLFLFWKHPFCFDSFQIELQKFIRSLPYSPVINHNLFFFSFFPSFFLWKKLTSSFSQFFSLVGIKCATFLVFLLLCGNFVLCPNSPLPQLSRQLIIA